MKTLILIALLTFPTFASASECSARAPDMFTAAELRNEGYDIDEVRALGLRIDEVNLKTIYKFPAIDPASFKSIWVEYCGYLKTAGQKGEAS